MDRWTTYREPPSQEIWPERLPVGRHRSLVLFPHMPAHSDPPNVFYACLFLKSLLSTCSTVLLFFAPLVL